MPLTPIVEALFATAVAVGTKHTDVPRRLTVVVPEAHQAAEVLDQLGSRLAEHFGTRVDIDIHPRPGPPQVRWVQFGARSARKKQT